MSEKQDLNKFRQNWINELQQQNVQSSQILDEPDLKKTKKDNININKTDTPSSSHSQCNDLSATYNNNQLCSNKSNHEHLSQGQKLLVENNIVEDVNPDTSCGYYPFVLLGEMLKSGSKEYRPTHSSRKFGDNSQIIKSPPILKRAYFNEGGSVTLSPTEESQSLNTSDKELNIFDIKKDNSLNVSLESTTSNEQRSFLDLFVADLDEINEIPFFDTSLAREVAVKIFQHLNMIDLCRCSQVSKSWKSLADDELLWCQLCHRLGYEGEITTIEKQGWKNSVRHYVERKKTLLANWKNRTGKYHQLQHVQGGILCSVHSYQDLVAAGYTNCDVKLWNLSDDENVILKSSNTALVIDESVDAGTVSNQVQHVYTSRKYTAACYTHGFVDIWRNDKGTEPIHTFNSNQGGISQICISNHKPLVSIATENDIKILQADQHGQFESTNLQLNNVKKLKWLEPDNVSLNCDPKLVLADYNKLFLYDTENHITTEIYNTIDTNVRCFDCHLQPDLLAVGIHFFSPVAEHKIKLLDLKSNQIISTLHGHTWIISCLSVSDNNTLISGSGDRKVRIYDQRQGQFPVLTVIGHTQSVATVQMDDWKIVSSDVGGFVSVRDIRTSRKLWELHNRHPVEYCQFYDKYLTVGNVPVNKDPAVDAEFETATHRKYRGTVQVYDFLADQLRDDIPDICLSTYNQAPAYNFNIHLATPYDNL